MAVDDPGASSPPQAEGPTTATVQLRGAGASLAQVAERFRGDPEPVAAGTRLGRYLLLEKLGQGGMGVVYKAFDPDLDRNIAVKVLNAKGAASAHARDRLLREAQALAQLAHPNIVSVHDVGIIDGAVYLAMELVDGMTLGAWLAAAPRPPAEVLRLMLQAGEGLAAAHGAGLVHRDFKPDNVAIGQDGRVRVLDFGLARIADALDEGPVAASPPTDPVSPPPLPSPNVDSQRARRGLLSTPLTQAGAVLGTPAYMAPEQICGDEIGPAADQFAYCLVLYQAFYRQHPFEGPLPEELLKRIAAGAIQPPPAGVSVPRHVRAAVWRGLAGEAQARHASMAVLLAELRRDPGRRWRRAALAATVTALAGLAAFGLTREPSQPLAAPACAGEAAAFAGAWSEDRRARLRGAFAAAPLARAAATLERLEPALDHWRADWLVAHQQICAATRVAGVQSEALLDRKMYCLERRRVQMITLLELLSTAPDKAAIDGAASAVAALADVAACRDTARYEAPPIASAQRSRARDIEAKVDRAEVLERTARYDEGLALAEEASAGAEELAYLPLLALAQLRLGTLRERKGDHKGAEAIYRRAVELAGASGDATTAARALTALVATVGVYLERFDDARELVWNARMTVGLAGAPARLRAQLATVEGALAMRERKIEAALARFTENEPLVREAFGENSMEYAAALNQLGIAHHGLLHLQEARTYYERSIALFERLLGPQHPILTRPLSNLGYLVVDLGDLEAAERYTRRAIVLSEAVFGPAHPETARVVSMLGTVLTEQGRLAEAEVALRRGLTLGEANMGRDHASLAGDWESLGDVLRQLGRFAEGDAALRRAEELAKPSEGGVEATLVQAKGELACARGELARGEKLLREALALSRASAGSWPSEAPRITVALARCYLDGKRPSQAVALLEPLVASFAEDIELVVQAEARELLARTLWEIGRERPRALDVATRARDDYERAGRKRRAAVLARWTASLR